MLLVAGLALVGAGVAGTRPRPVAATQATAREFVVRDVRLFDGERIVPRTNVHVRDGIIVSVGSPAPTGVESIAGEGRTLMPGLIDAHTHAFGDALDGP